MDAVRMPDFDESALCSQIGDVEMFIPVKGASVAIPKQVCRMCPWIDQCLEYALAVDVYGVWGGTSRGERIKMREDLGIVAVSVMGRPLDIVDDRWDDESAREAQRAYNNGDRSGYAVEGARYMSRIGQRRRRAAAAIETGDDAA